MRIFQLLATGSMLLSLSACVSAEQYARNLAKQDDALCQSWGYQFGSAGYSNCRQQLYVKQQENMQEAARINQQIQQENIRQQQINSQNLMNALTAGQRSPSQTSCNIYGNTANCTSY